MFRHTVLAIALAIGTAASAQAQTLPPLDSPLAARAMAELQALQLTPAQRIELLRIVDAARMQHADLRAQQEQLLDDASGELATDDVDLRTLAARQQALTDARIVGIRATRDDLLDFYDTLTPSQQHQVHDWLLRQIERAERAWTAVDALRAALR